MKEKEETVSKIVANGHSISLLSVLRSNFALITQRRVFEMNVLLYTLKRKGHEVLGAEVKEIDLPNETSARLKTMYEVMNCDMVEHIAFEYRGEEYDLWCDEEFLLKECPITTLLIGDLKPNRFTVICGNFIISHTEESTGGMSSLSKADVRKLRGFIDEGQLKLKIAFAKGLIGRRN